MLDPSPKERPLASAPPAPAAVPKGKERARSLQQVGLYIFDHSTTIVSWMKPQEDQSTVSCWARILFTGAVWKTSTVYLVWIYFEGYWYFMKCYWYGIEGYWHRLEDTDNSGWRTTGTAYKITGTVWIWIYRYCKEHCWYCIEDYWSSCSIY